MSVTIAKYPERLDDSVLTKTIDPIIRGIRIPDLPYPLQRIEPDDVADWRLLLRDCWNEQRNETVIHLLNSTAINWTVAQVNAAYIADRVMDLFLDTSGLHLVLARKVARLRFFLAWRLAQEGGRAFNECLRGWLDSLEEWRGWSDSGGRSSRVLIDQLDGMVGAVASSFECQSPAPFLEFCEQWERDALVRREKSGKLRERLLSSETGMARQRQAEQTARAAIGRALTQRHLPKAVSGFIREHWLVLLRQAVFANGVDSDEWRHANKLLEWLVWIGDPSLSEGENERLYHVGEQIGDKLEEVWERVQGAPLTKAVTAGIEAVIVSRLKGEPLELEPAFDPLRFPFDEAWLRLTKPASKDLAAATGHWFVKGSGASEQRRYFFTLLADTNEVLWTNGFGVKLGISTWREFVEGRNQGTIRPLPASRPFQEVLAATIGSLDQYYRAQVEQRKEAAERAKAQAEALRCRIEEAEARKRDELEAQRQEQLKAQAALERQQREQREAEARKIRQQKEEVARQSIDSLKPGGWIVVESGAEGEDPRRLKLAVRITATDKLIFVDRLGLNRTEYTINSLIEDLVAGRARVLSGTAEFDDTLARVVGSIRLGKS